MLQPITPFEGMDIRSLLDSVALSRSEHPFLVWEPFTAEGGRQWTYGEFADRVRRFAAGIVARGVKAGDRVLIHLDNCPEGLIAWLGCAYAGVVPVTTNARSTEDELAYFAHHSDAVAAVTQPGFADIVRAATPKVRWRLVTETDNGEPASAPGLGFHPFDTIDASPESLPERPHDPWAPFGIQYTSGTTARPKAVLWTHANALWGAMACARHEDLRAEDVHLTFLPLFHTNAQVYSVLASLWVGATVVLMPRFSASRFWPVSIKHGATWTSLVPFCLKALMSEPLPEQHSYRLWGNAVCDPPTDRHFRVRTIGWWGMTETVAHGIVGLVNRANTSMSLGRPAPGYEIHVLDDEEKPVRPGEVGNLYVRGQRGVTLFLEYAGDPEATQAAFRPDGLFITGDRVRLGEDGFLYFADRSKDMLKVGGENVAASEIEQVIAAVPGVAEVAVVAMPDPMLDEVPVAFVLPNAEAAADLAERVADACAAKLARFKRPKLVRIVENLPRSTLEKVAKSELRAALIAERDTARPAPAGA
ncbi:AMP-binding protein [Sphingomonas sp. LaA6.9]|uniref:AMP-binding protein n=1 Tax=Sphingomonas sp. LaA6.9 TaxID=2919914 RepID=UPI001F4FEA40|nr:AMP-binding protein [Sphingomonas sp. LaA6.9]MCJ8158298.1 AMP-binding protein [Sphingomonas sp. LaA6.9]